MFCIYTFYYDVTDEKTQICSNRSNCFFKLTLKLFNLFGLKLVCWRDYMICYLQGLSFLPDLSRLGGVLLNAGVGHRKRIFVYQVSDQSQNFLGQTLKRGVLRKKEES